MTTPRSKTAPVKRAQPFKPAGVKEPQDHPDPKKTAAQLEAEGVETVDVEHDGATYVFPATLEDASGDVWDALDARKISLALQGLLGEDQWTEFKKSKPLGRDYNRLWKAYQEAAGFGEGN